MDKTKGMDSQDGKIEYNLFPEIEPYFSERLRVSDIHELYVEQSGNPNGKPVIFVHGGPGGGCSTRDRRFFNSNVYKIILFDQRGAGKSTPAAELTDNTTWDLVEDIEKIRKHLGIDRWVVFGGSWGSTLSLAYAEKYTSTVKALVLRGIFALRREELLWFYQEGASWLFPEYWEEYLEAIPENERGDLMTAYHKRLTGDNEEERMRCAQAWTKWEMATSRLFCDHSLVKKAGEDLFALQFACIENHFFVNRGFFRSNDQILTDAAKLEAAGIPCVIVQGRYDLVCPMKTAWDLKKIYRSAELIVVANAGHSAKEDGITSYLVRACQMFENL